MYHASLFIPCHTTVAGYYGFALDVRVSVVRPSVSHTSVRISFPGDNLSKHQWIFTKLGCALILWRSGLGLLICKFCQTGWSYLPQTRQYFHFQTITLYKCQGILTKFGSCIDIKEIWFWIANGQFLSMFDRVICPRHDYGGVL